jgi:hypothetical protein
MEYWEIQALAETFGIILVILIPVAGLTLRFGLKPFLRDMAEIKAARSGAQITNAGQTDERLTRIEHQLESLESSVRRLAEVADFDRQLKKGRPED